MFGCFRTLLALAVVFEHLGPIHYAGPYAVFGFYVLSGFLMTFIMHETYGYTMHGLGRYVLNRWLRIFPIYWLACALSLLLVAILGEPFTRAFHENIGYPASIEEAFRNLGLVLSIHTDTRLVPPAWALTVECVYYLLIGLGLSRNFKVTLALLGASLAYTTYLAWGGASFSYRYYTVPAASLPFLTGATIYHLGNRGAFAAHWFRSNWVLIALGAGALANYAFALLGGRAGAVSLHFYLNLVVLAVLVAHLSQRRSARFHRLDKALGDLSYPIYLMHFQGALVVAALLPSLARGQGAFLTAALPIVLLLAWAMTRLIEKPIESVRSALRSGAAAGRDSGGTLRAAKQVEP